MDIKITEERANPLLQRKEYGFTVVFPGTGSPKREEVRAMLAEALKIPKDRLVVEWMHPSYGAPSSRGVAHAYDSKEALAKTVRSHIQIRNGLKAKEAKGPKAPAAEAPTPAAKEEPASKAEAKGEKKA